MSIRLLRSSSHHQCYRPRYQAFSTTTRWRWHTSELDGEKMKSLKVHRDRLMKDIHHTAQWGTGERWGKASAETGMSRLALSDADKSARDWFVKTTEELGCKTTVDAMGNIFAVRPGQKDGPPIYAGSHLDTQPTGGRYDGVLGVTAAIEMLRVLNDNWVETEYPVGVVNWTNEEGARFPISMVSSGVWSGSIPLDHAHNLKEVGSGTATMKSELERIGYLGSTPASHEAIPMAAHFELHIEQGPILESERHKIGIVQGVQAYRWFTIHVKGQDCHTGTTPFNVRSDALLTAAKMILQSHRAATKHGALASTGILTLKPGSTNTVPGDVKFSLDIRAAADKTLDALEQDLRDDFALIASASDVAGLNTHGTPGLPCTVSWSTDSISSATTFHSDCISCVEAAAKVIFGDETEKLTKTMTSGAGHDSVYTSKVCPTSMIFVPSKGGVSHNPREFTSEEDCTLGAQVLVGSVVECDRRRVRG
ncbi:Zn-dependent exopeptidase [Patellaria atrata CBS 101060]|uniref:Zn-dependent exopeptidase n=1 Tax=Patellaria atrata CBS 101060 TaxID=1346257 RepID=A0A9P4SD86_9PEZI|nr:Zn-dependent exopeptidase [Patellaria atrata CBS 101060]